MKRGRIEILSYRIYGLFDIFLRPVFYGKRLKAKGDGCFVLDYIGEIGLRDSGFSFKVVPLLKEEEQILELPIKTSQSETLAFGSGAVVTAYHFQSLLYDFNFQRKILNFEAPNHTIFDFLILGARPQS